MKHAGIQTDHQHIAQFIWQRISKKYYIRNFELKLNIFNFEQGFLFDTIKEIISSKKTNITDSSNNNYSFENTKINLKTNEIVGKELRIDFIDSFFGNEKNDPKLSGKSAFTDDDKTKVFKTVFSTCNMINKSCRGWELQSEEFTHDKKKKNI